MKTIICLLLLLSLGLSLPGQDTFSIVAVDSLTGEIGSAGASCLDEIQFPGSNGAIIISDIIPGRGAIHTQASWIASNQNNAHARMVEGLSPLQIINWLKMNDAAGIFGIVNRQYGIVDFDTLGHPRSAGYTGTNCYDWKGHKTGTYYAIQGNILLGPEILDSMEARFLATPGPLADRLMAALQGANVPGADTRCLSNGTSSLSAFIKVAKPDDNPDSLYLQLNVPSLPAGQEPIDSLQTLFNQWKTTGTHTEAFSQFKVFPNPVDAGVFNVVSETAGALQLVDLHGRVLLNREIPAGNNRILLAPPPGLYLVRFSAPNKPTEVLKLIFR